MNSIEQKPKKRKLKFRHYYLIVFASFICFVIIYGEIRNMDFRSNQTEIVAKFIKREKKKYRKAKTRFYFGFNYNGKYYETSASGVHLDMFNSANTTQIINDLKVNHFYSAKFNPEYLNRIDVNPSKEITDTILIKNAGFKVE